MGDTNDLLLGLVQSMARHSALRGDALTSVLSDVVTCLTKGTRTPRIEFVTAPLAGENLLLAHEVELRDALADAGLPVVEPDDPAALGSAAAAVIDDAGAAVLPLTSVAGPLGALRLATPPAGWDDASLGFATSVVSELTVTLLRHWTERQHLDRSGALLEAQRHTHVGCFEWDIVTNKVRWSDELFRIFGNEPQSFEPTFEEFLERIHDDDREAVRASVYEAYEERRDYRIEERIVRPDGSVRQLASWGHVLVDERTVPIKIIGSCQDVTDFRAAMHELALTERRLAEVQERRARALELNDNVVQGLVTAIFALELGHVDKATTALNGTLSSARSIIGDMLMSSEEDMEAIGLVRSAPAHSYLEEGPAPDAPAAGTSPVRVVIADDSSDMRLLTSLILDAEDDFHVVAEAADGEAAVAAVATHHPDILLLDLAMPVLDGLSAIPALREASPDTMIVVFSGFNAGSAAQEALERGAHAYVEKGLIDRPLPGVLREIRKRPPGDTPTVASANG
jgi:CheY-like chemotaxis protein